MPDSTFPNENHRYTGREVGLVLKRAAELEERRHRDLAGHGLTRAQVRADNLGNEVAAITAELAESERDA